MYKLFYRATRLLEMYKLFYRSLSSVLVIVV